MYEILSQKIFRLNIITNEKFNNFYRKYSGLEKVADLAVQVKNNIRVCESIFISEIELSEPYEKLSQDTKLWLKGS